MLLHSVPFKKQTGAALLALMLVLVIGSSYFLVIKLNTNLALTQQSKKTGLALSAAKDALIGYAVSYPDKVNPDFGPGYLPCPDITNNGSAGGSCSLNGTTSIGRFPYKTLEAEDLRDGHGERLWYVVSDNFRNNPKLIPLNSETASNTSGDLTVNGYGDIAAIIFVADAPENNQNRTLANVNDYTHYIEATFTDSDSNAIINRIDTAATDRYILLTKDELMQAVEKRVLGEVRMMLTNYFDFIDDDNDGDAAYPWLMPFADPKASMPPLSGEHDGGDGAATLSDSSRDFNVWGVAIGDVVRNVTDGSIGTITAVAATTLTIAGGLSLGTENDFDDGDEYSIYPAALAGLGQLRGVATNANNNDSLEDTNNDFNELDITPGDIVDNITDGSSGVVDTVSANELTLITLPNARTLSGGTENDFDNGDSYRIRSQHGQATADTDANGLTLEDINNNFVVMGVQVGDLVVNITDGSTGRVSIVAANTLTIDDLKFGSDNIFEVNDYYSLPRYNANNGTREGLLAFHEVGEAFKTGFNFDWVITVNAGDITVSNSLILQNYMQNYAASGSDSFGDSIGVCIWLLPDIADCYGYFKDFVNISGTLTSGSDTDIITDSTAQFSTDGIKRGDIAQNYDDEDTAFVFSGVVDALVAGLATAGSTNLKLEDTTEDFTVLAISIGDEVNNITDGSTGIIGSISTNEITVLSLSGGTDNDFSLNDNYEIYYSDKLKLYDASADFSVYEPYSYVIQNSTLAIDLSVTRIQGIISDIIDADTLVAVSYVGQDSTPIEFRVGDNYTIHQPYNAVVTSVSSETQLSTDNYTSALDPDFDSGEYYRIMPAANSYSGTVISVVSTGTPDRFRDTSANFLTEGISVGDIIENTTTGAFGEIIAVVTDGIETTLYNGTPNDFTVGDSYTVYHEHVFSREHIFHAKFRGNQGTNTVSEERVRDVCLGYTSDCSALSTAVNFTGNGGDPFITVVDYEEDEITEVGRATFIPSAASSGSIRVSDIDYYLQEADGELPDWFITNKWHQLVYIAYSAGDSPNGGAICTAGTDCLTLTGGGSPDNNKRAMVIIAGEETNTNLDASCSLINPGDDTVTAMQDRSTGLIYAYYEGEICSEGDNKYGVLDKPPASSFDNLGITNKFNDQIRVLDTSP